MGKPKQAPKRTVRTSNAALQAKLDLLARFVGEDNIDEFVKNFVPLDLSAEDLEFYTYDYVVAKSLVGGLGVIYFYSLAGSQTYSFRTCHPRELAYSQHSIRFIICQCRMIYV